MLMIPSLAPLQVTFVEATFPARAGGCEMTSPALRTIKHPV